MKSLVTMIAIVLMLACHPFTVMAQDDHGAAASGEEPAVAHEEAHESPWALVFRWANFAILLGALGYLLRKPAQEFFNSRTNEIIAGLERAKKAQSEADVRMHDIEQRLGRLSGDLSALQSQAAAESSREREKILSEARLEAERVVEQSRQEIERIAKGIERDVREKIADVVVGRAGQTLATSMTEGDQKRIVVRFLKNL